MLTKFKNKLGQGYQSLSTRNVFSFLGWILHRKALGKTGTNIMNEDWDNLLILDACRYKEFERLNFIDGDLSSIISVGSSTPEFLKKTYIAPDEEYGDTVYISANPQTSKYEIGLYFHHMIDAWEDIWDDELQTVPPSELTEKALDVVKTFNDKRIIVHYIQPHYPFIGETGRNISHRSVEGGGIVTDTRTVDESIWQRLERGELDVQEVQSAYEENLEMMIPSIDKFVNEVSGKTVVTSDHGNSFGKWGIYGHPSRRYSEDLVKVPWLETDFENRRDIKDGNVDKNNINNKYIEKRLDYLGYK